MNNKRPFEKPILLIWFNRPNHARRVLDELRTIQPTTLFIAVDGPREGHLADVKQVRETISLLDQIDWPCQVHRLIRPANLGCKRGVSSAISWFFEAVEAGIILEDDCLPNPTFFSFCADLLVRYQADERVMHIGGTNLVTDFWQGDSSYLFTKIAHIWGWATWRRAWQLYDLSMRSYPAEGKAVIDRTVADAKSRVYWKAVFDEAYTNRVDTWDYQWVYSVWAANGLCVLPRVNMITNIGFDADATHTKATTAFANLPTEALTSLQHPSQIAEDQIISDYLFRTLYRLPSSLTVLLEKVKKGIKLFKPY